MKLPLRIPGVEDVAHLTAGLDRDLHGLLRGLVAAPSLGRQRVVVELDRDGETVDLRLGLERDRDTNRRRLAKRL